MSSLTHAYGVLVGAWWFVRVQKDPRTSYKRGRRRVITSCFLARAALFDLEQARGVAARLRSLVGTKRGKIAVVSVQLVEEIASP